MEMAIGRHAGEIQRVGRMSRDAGTHPVCEVIH